MPAPPPMQPRNKKKEIALANKLIVAPAPHVHGSESTQKIMRDVLLALTPALVFSVVAFGWRR